MPLIALVLAVAVFAQGTSEFMLAGLLVDVARDLAVSPAAAGALTSAYAVGMVVGAPLAATAGARVPPRTALVALLGAFVVAHVAGALASTYAVLLATRIVAALANAGFLAIALATVRRAVPEHAVGRAVAAIVAAISLASIVGVPAGAALAQGLGWRSTFWAVAALCLPALAVLLAAPALRGDGLASRLQVGRELRALTARPVAGTLVIAVLVNAGTFGAFTYLGLLGERAGLTASTIPWLLAAFGLGAFAGVQAAGRWADARERAWIRVGCLVLGAVWTSLALAATSPEAVVALAAVAGATAFGVGSALIARIVRTTGDAPVLGGASATVALNVGAAAGPLLAGAALAPLGPSGVAWTAAALAAVAAVASLVAFDGRRATMSA